MSIFLFFLTGIILFYVFLFFPLTSGIIGIASASFLTAKKRPFLIILLVFGFVYAFLRYSPPLDTSALSNRELMIDCVVDDSARELSNGSLVNDAKITAASDADSGESFGILKGRELEIISDEGLIRGLRYMMTAKTARDMERLNPLSMRNDSFYARLEEIRKSEVIKENPMNAWLRERRDKLNGYLKNNLGSDQAALLSAMTTGERSAMSEELNGAFAATGLAHLLSISGTHFGLFSVLIFGIFRLAINLMPYKILQRLTVYLTPSQAAALMSIPFMLLYLLISGSNIPALRSFIMISIFLVGLLIGRKGLWLNSLLFAAFVICLWDPSAILNLSFQLSFLAVLFIGLTLGDKAAARNASRVTDGESGFLDRFFGILKNSLILSLSASLGTAPLVAYYFHYFSMISPVTNLIITPFIGFILVPLALFSSFAFIFSGHYPLKDIISFITDLAIKGVKLFASPSFADIKIPAFPLIAIIIFYAGVAVYFLSGKKRYALMIPLVSIIICLFPLIATRNEVRVTYLDVGQGDSAVIEGYKGKTIVIDTGRTGKEPEAYLKYIGKRTIDALILTHADDDHSGGTFHLLKTFSVKEIWDNGLLIYPDGYFDGSENIFRRSLERGDEATADGLMIQVLHPYRGFYTFEGGEGVNENNDSLVIKVTGKTRSFLFTADTEEGAEEDMIHLGKWLKSDVIKVPHHGSRSSSSISYLKTVSPEIAVISVGRHNSYDHPHAETLSRYEGIRIYRTDRDGAVKITESSADGGLSVKTYKSFALERISWPGTIPILRLHFASSVPHSGGLAEAKNRDSPLSRMLGGEWRNIKRLFMRW